MRAIGHEALARLPERVVPSEARTGAFVFPPGQVYREPVPRAWLAARKDPSEQRLPWDLPHAVEAVLPRGQRRLRPQQDGSRDRKRDCGWRPARWRRGGSRRSGRCRPHRRWSFRLDGQLWRRFRSGGAHRCRGGSPNAVLDDDLHVQRRCKLQTGKLRDDAPPNRSRRQGRPRSRPST